MKTLLQRPTCLLAAGLLLAATTSPAATDTTTRPLRATVLAKPNVIFALDDSGSMDMEVLIEDTVDGAVWWDYVRGNGWAGGRPLPGGSGSEFWKYFYLFPNGTGAGNKVYGDYNRATGGRRDPHDIGFAVPPTPTFAWARSSAYNKMYYDPMATYMPWAPAEVGGVTVKFGPAIPTAARSHPTNGTTTVNLTAEINTTAEDWRFTYLEGQIIPAGSTVHQCYHGNGPSSLPRVVTPGALSCITSSPYYPATYWQREACVVDNIRCTLAPDGTTLKRYEVKAGNTFPSGRSYAAEMQNFANWFTYYRKRRLSLAAAVGMVLGDVQGARYGIVVMNDHKPVTMYDSEAEAANLNWKSVAGKLYAMPEWPKGTPTRETLLYIGTQYQRTDNDTLGNQIIQYACQRNSQFVLTDGFATPAAVTVPGYSKAKWGAAAPYATTHAQSLADIGLANYTINPRPLLPLGLVPTDDPSKKNPDLNPDLHINTHAITLGLKGYQWPGVTDPFATPPTWLVPSTSDPTQIDDLWHATLNGRGIMAAASTAATARKALTSALGEFIKLSGVQGSIAVSATNLKRDSDGLAYLGGYESFGWTGDLTAQAINKDTGAISDAITWSAAAKLAAQPPDERAIATYYNGAGRVFSAANVGAVVNPGNKYGATADVIAYLRGDRSKEGTEFRERQGLMGAVVNAEPVLHDGVVYQASGEGMLHAFATGAGGGKELWAYIPGQVLPTLGAQVEPGWTFNSKLEGTPTIGLIAGGRKLLVGGQGVGGNSYYAIDVTNGKNLNESTLASAVKWEFPNSTEVGRMGQAVGRPAIVRLNSGKYAVLLTSGYNTPDGSGTLWALDAATGEVLRRFTITASSTATEVGLAQVTGFFEPSGAVRYVYGGDLQGNVYRFDLDTGNRMLMATLRNGSGGAQPVTAAPEIFSQGEFRVVAVGTGRILSQKDFGNASVNTMYAIADTSTSTLSNARSSLVRQTLSGTGISSNAVEWGRDRGWYIDLPAGEQIVSRPMAGWGVVGFVSNKNGAMDCTASSKFYWVSTKAGSLVEGMNWASLVLSSTANATRTQIVQTPEGVRFINRTFDKKNSTTAPIKPPAITPTKNAWREVRR